jgi:hypothetical protein
MTQVKLLFRPGLSKMLSTAFLIQPPANESEIGRTDERPDPAYAVHRFHNDH